MSKPPVRTPPAKPAEIVGQTLERALDPLRTAFKGAALRRADRQARQFSDAPGATAPPTAGKPGLAVAPNAVAMPHMPAIPGVELAAGRAGLYRHERPDVLLMRFAEGTTCAGVFTRHGVGSAPVDWCKRHLEASGGKDVRALAVNAGCANSFTGRPGADAARRVASAVAKAFDCRQGQVLMASTGVIGELLPDAKITARVPEIARHLSPAGWDDAARAIMTTDTFPKGACAEAEIDGEKVRIAGIAKGSGMIAPDMATMLAFVAT
ncbi:MAG TPA: bifunctional ornithine acetyltransferase/N-acetylglutamate synthase, partial [Caulobacteraceae bacterium]